MKNYLLLVLLALMLSGCATDTADNAQPYSTDHATLPNCFLDGNDIDCDWNNVSDAWMQVSPAIFATKSTTGK